MKKLLLVLAGVVLLTACDDTPNIVGKYESVDGNKEVYGRVEQSPKDKEIFGFKGRMICDFSKFGLGKRPRSKTVVFNIKGNKLIKPHSNKEEVRGTFDGKNLSIKEGSCQGSFKKAD